MPARIAIIGGGFAGLRAAVSLADAGRPVSLFEGRAALGGRARSFTDPSSGEVVDNGQHLFLAGYDRTMAFLKRLGTADRIVFQERLKVRFVEPGGKSSLLNCPAAPAPWHLLLGIWMLKGMPLRDKLALASIWREVRAPRHPEAKPARHPEAAKQPKDLVLTSGETVEQWLTRLGQGERSLKMFWCPLTVAALNEEPSKACAAGLKAVLQRMMSGSWSDVRLGMASVGLSELYGDSARRIIEERGGQVFLNRPVTGLRLEDGKARAVLFANGSRFECDAVISAVPPSVLVKILPADPATEPLIRTLGRFGFSPILSVNLWFDSPWMEKEELFTALIGTRFQWLFNKQAILARSRSTLSPSASLGQALSKGQVANYVSLIVSAAYDLLSQTNEELTKLALHELKSCFLSSKGARLVRSQVVREKDATVSLTVEAEKTRPGAKTEIENLVLAGDWTATGLPATIESAVLSGEAASKELLNWLATSSLAK